MGIGRHGERDHLHAFICLIGSIPAAALNAVVLGRLARRGVDQAVVAAISGGLIGLLVAFVLFEIVANGGLNVTVALWFSATGALMGLLHWIIAIRPRRLWRLALRRDEEAIRAME